MQKDTGVNSVEAQCELALVLALVKRTLEHVEYERHKERKEAALKDDGRIEKGKGVLLIVSDAAGTCTAAEASMDKLALTLPCM